MKYEIDDGRVWFRHWHYRAAGGKVEVRGADPATFEQIGRCFGRDARTVYVASQAVSEADAASFVLEEGYSWHWGVDCRRAYCFYLPASFATGSPKWKAIETDPRSFRYIDEDGDRWFARDDRRVYFAGRGVRGADAASFAGVSIDVDRRGGTPFFVDANHVYGYKRPIPGSVPEGFVAFSYPGLRPTYGIDPGRRMLYQPDVRTWGWREEPLEAALEQPCHVDVVRYLSEHPELAERLSLVSVG